MATSIAPHNLDEVVDAMNFILAKPEARDEEILEIIKRP